jgi:hypothetical protein
LSIAGIGASIAAMLTLSLRPTTFDDGPRKETITP